MDGMWRVDLKILQGEVRNSTHTYRGRLFWNQNTIPCKIDKKSDKANCYQRDYLRYVRDIDIYDEKYILQQRKEVHPYSDMGPSKCLVPDCQKQQHIKGYCVKHAKERLDADTGRP